MQAAGPGRSAGRALGTHGLSPAASGVPQLVEPVLWDYGADLDVQGKGQYEPLGRPRHLMPGGDTGPASFLIGA